VGWHGGWGAEVAELRGRNGRPAATADWLAPLAGGLGVRLELERVRALFHATFACASSGMAITTEDGRILLANQALSQITGFTQRELGELTMRELIDPGDADLEETDSERLVAGDSPRSKTQLRLRTADGSSVWTEVTVSRDGEIEPVAFVYQMQDVSEPREVEGRLEYLLDHDYLTGLFNRHRFQQELDREIARHRRFGTGGAVLMLDLDGFKAVNDRFGHAAGDELLRGLSAEMRERSRATDVVARLGGDEFALLLPGVTLGEAESVAATLLGVIRHHVSTLGSERAHVTGSVGIALFDHLGDVELLALADAAMYAAKEAGRDHYMAFSSGDAPTNSRQIGEANALRRALEDDRFVLYCQPVYDLAARRIDQYELLIRMQGEADGDLIAPNAFLYAAERFGQITAIDCWVVSQAVSLIAAEERRGRHTTLAVNLSGHSIGHPELSSHIDRELDTSGIDPSSLVFELTETAAVGNLQAAQALSERLHQRGCRFALDDFGAGFASFYYLKNLPFDYIKIDGDFIRGLTNSPTDQLIVSAIVSIAKGMDKKTIAEFVADEATRDVLTLHGVDYAQGYYIAQPRPVREVLAKAP
jgi:diguanylate cyclase (GGDEF)-like protein/PAS domain S-box-containing protein